MNNLRILCLLPALFLFICTKAQYYNGRVRIDSADKSYVFQISDDPTITYINTFYYWFKSGRIHQTQGAYYGKLLHGDYKVIDADRRLLEKGQFKKGIKMGRWLTWHNNGRIKSKLKPRIFGSGFNLKEYDSFGNIAKKGYLKNGLFTGKEFSYINDSLRVTYFKNGLQLDHKPSLFKK